MTALACEDAHARNDLSLAGKEKNEKNKGGKQQLGGVI